MVTIIEKLKAVQFSKLKNKESKKAYKILKKDSGNFAIEMLEDDSFIADAKELFDVISEYEPQAVPDKYLTKSEKKTKKSPTSKKSKSKPKKKVFWSTEVKKIAKRKRISFAKAKAIYFEDREKKADKIKRVSEDFTAKLKRLSKDPKYKGKLSTKALPPNSTRSLQKDAQQKAIVPIKRLSPTFGKKNGAKQKYYYEYRPNRGDVDARERLGKGGDIIDDSGNYLDVTADKDAMTLKLSKEGKEEVKDLREDGKSDVDIMYELFEDIRNNSELEWHNDLGDAGFGLTSAPGITDGYYYDDDGDYKAQSTDENDNPSRVYFFSDYALRSEVDDLMDRGELVLNSGDDFAKGGSVRKYDMGDEGMFKGGEFRIMSHQSFPNRYSIKELDKDGKLIGKEIGINQKDFEASFTKFTKEKGGKIGFDALEKEVANEYKGKPVPKKYQKKYGKTYDAQEAKEVGAKVAGSVYQKQLEKKAHGGKVTKKGKEFVEWVVMVRKTDKSPWEFHTENLTETEAKAKEKEVKKLSKHHEVRAEIPLPFQTGGDISKGTHYIDYLNKDKNFQQDRKYFPSYASAEKWAKKDFEKFHPDMIHMVFEKGGEINVPTDAHNIRTASYKEIKAELNKAVDENNYKYFEKIWTNLYNADRDQEISRLILTALPTQGNKDIVSVLWVEVKKARKNTIGSHFKSGGEIKSTEGDKIYKLAEKMNKDQHDRLMKTLNKSEKELHDSLIKLGDSKEVALVTVLVKEPKQWRLKWLQDKIDGKPSIYEKKAKGGDMGKEWAKQEKIRANQAKVDEAIVKKYKDWSYPVPPVSTALWSVADWSAHIEKNGKKNFAKGGEISIDNYDISTKMLAYDVLDAVNRKNLISKEDSSALQKAAFHGSPEEASEARIKLIELLDKLPSATKNKIVKRYAKGGKVEIINSAKKTEFIIPFDSEMEAEKYMLDQRTKPGNKFKMHKHVKLKDGKVDSVKVTVTLIEKINQKEEQKPWFEGYLAFLNW